MVVRMMKWRPWPPLATRKYEVRLTVKRLEGWRFDQVGGDSDKFGVEIRWKGQKVAFTSLRRKAKEAKRSLTREVCCGHDGVVSWDEDFHATCRLSLSKDNNNVFHPWEISFSLFNGANQGTKNKAAFIGTASLNVADYASRALEEDVEINIPVSLSGATSDIMPSLCVSVGLLELRNAQESIESRAVVPVPSSPMTGETSSPEKDEVSAIKVGLRKVKFFTDYVSSRRSKKACREDGDSEGRGSSKSEDGDYTFTLDSDSFDSEEGESEEVKEDDSIRKSFSYGTLAHANCAGGSFFSCARIGGEEDDWVYYSHRKSDVGCSLKEDISEPSLLQTSKRSILSWRKRKISFRSPKAKGEPLLKKAYAEEGGDDIDYDRRQLSSDESLSLRSKSGDDSNPNRLSVSEFGDDNFAIGSWEQKDIICRDGLLKLQTQVFFASIDQRNERAAGESACTGLVTVIADWFQSNRGMLPIKSQFDTLIREGSLEWRRLCENAVYRERFPDRHFDLETVLQAKIRPLSVVASKSFIGFFHPEGMDEGSLEFLQGAMSFDSIWDEISRAAAEIPDDGAPLIFIVSWNDHFFVLKVEPEAYYIIDTLGERLYEGCNQAYILKFDRNTMICDMPKSSQPAEVGNTGNNLAISEQNNCKDVNGAESLSAESQKAGDEMRIICQGKESCKEYIKNFLAAIPMRELLVDIKKGLMSSTPLHHRLQIEFHFTQLLQPKAQVPGSRRAVTVAQAAEVATSDDAITA